MPLILIDPNLFARLLVVLSLLLVRGPIPSRKQANGLLTLAYLLPTISGGPVRDVSVRMMEAKESYEECL
jgi:hypothetical protein